ncbi:hypothetical protein GCM10009864_40190 [Streptomyces lunalinharesii]|uniref:Uncharacterized protein n=1 Tax=Streptomyces lunalinharesii TaxID=333384 RepID=A0ABN3S2V7_9ACTN
MYRDEHDGAGAWLADEQRPGRHLSPTTRRLLALVESAYDALAREAAGGPPTGFP